MVEQQEINGKLLDKRKALIINIIGTVAATISAVSLLPQVRDIIVTKNVSGLSLSSYTLLLVTACLWVTYHTLLGTYHGAIAGSCGAIFSGVIVYYILKYQE